MTRGVCGCDAAGLTRRRAFAPRRAVPSLLVARGRFPAPPPQPPAEISPLGPETVPPSQREVDYPLMREMHAASSLHTAEEVHRWRGGAPLTRFPPPVGQGAQLQPLSDAEMSHDPIEQVILRRGS